MKSAEQIEQPIRRLAVEASAEGRERTIQDLVETHNRQKEEMPASRGWSLRRTIMTHGTRKVAAVVALAIVLVGTLSLGTGSVALSEAGHAVNSTLARLRAMIVGTEGEPEAQSPDLPNKAGEETPNPNRKAILCAARFFVVAPNEHGVWQSLREQGIELIQASTDPEVYYTALSRQQAQSFDASTTLRCSAAPRITVLEGDSGTIAIADRQAARGLALAWLPTMSNDGKEVQSTISFHDGRKGFEIPNVSTEPGGAVLIRMNGIAADPGDGGQDREGLKDALIRIQVDIP